MHGNQSATKELEDFCVNQQIVQERIFTPKVGEVVNATLEPQIYNVKLKDELVSSLKFHKLREYELAWVDAIIKTRNQNDYENYNNVPVSNSNIQFGFSLHPMPKESLKMHKTVFVNEPKLSDLKHIFSQNNIQAEFHGGVLVCNGTIALKKVCFV